MPAAAPARASEPVVPDEEVLGTEHVRGELGLIRGRLRQHTAADDPLTVRAVGRIGADRDTVPLFRSWLALRPVPETVVWAAGISGQPSLARDLLALLDDESAPRVAAIEALGMLGDERVDGWLIPLLKSPDASTRVAACLALSRLPS